MPAAPTGTVTFLFTDIEGSTRLWETFSDRMGEALAQHDRLMRDAIEGRDGYVFKTVGDAFCAAFATASDALAASLDAHRALGQASWGDTGRLKVRFAMHTGTAEERGGDYFGPSLNRVARLLGTGHGDQILLSLAAAELVRDALPDGVALEDLGRHRLKDLIRPEHVFSVRADGLPIDLPPLKSLDARRTNLPIQPTSLVGRDAEIAEVVALLRGDDARIVTLTGPGGTGKTRLALQAGADMLDAMRDGVWFVALEPVRDADSVIAAIAQALGVHETDDEQPLEARLIEHLRERHLLLVLDNFEQVVDAAPVVSRLLAAAAGLKVLVTSRFVLKIYGEHEWPVAPLSLPDPRALPSLEKLAQYDAVKLFIDRARAVKPSFAITNDNAPAVAEICVRLDGLPLAIELAAARTKLFAPEKLLARLDDSLKLLTGGGRDLPERQRTLRGAIDWSHELLSAPQRALFRRMGVFLGGATLETAEALCALEDDEDPVDVFDGLEQLADMSLVRQVEDDTGEPRFRMLQTLRDYALEKLAAAGEADARLRQHAERFLFHAEEHTAKLKGPEQKESLDALDREHENLRGALGWARGADPALLARLAITLERFWRVRGYLTEGRHWLEHAVAQRGPLPDWQQSSVLQSAGWMAREQGDARRATELLEACVEVERGRGDPAGLAEMLYKLGKLAMEQGDFGRSTSIYDECRALFDLVGDPDGVARALTRLGEIAIQEGDLARASEILEGALEIGRATGDGNRVANTLKQLGYLAIQRGDLDRAIEIFEERLELQSTVGDLRGVARALDNLALAATSLGDEARAAAWQEQALGIRRELGDKRGVAASLLTSGKTAVRGGDAKTGRARFDEGLRLYDEVGDRGGVSQALEAFAMLAVAEAEAERAARLFGGAAALREELDKPLKPTTQTEHDQLVAALRTQLDDAAFDRAYAEGHAMSLEGAIALALAER